MSPSLSGFVDIAHRIIWCTLATVDDYGRPRSRLVHPVWTVEGGEVVGRVASRRTSPKSGHLAVTPYASCSYWDPEHDVAVAECHASWDPEPAGSWDVFRGAPAPPVGFDPAAMFAGGLGSPDAGIVVLRPWRVRWGRAADLAAGSPQSVWTGRRPLAAT